MNEQVELAIKNFDKQDAIFNDPARYKIVVKGRRFGLTRGAANDAIRKALAGRFTAGLWVDTINANIDRYVERYFLPHLNKLPKDLWKWQKQGKVLNILNAYIDFRSADKPESIEGFGYDWVFLNEAGIILKDEYLWNNSIRPMLIDHKAPAVIGGTPKGKTLFHQLAVKAKDQLEPEYKYFHMTTFDNPYIDANEVEAMINDMGGRESFVVRQEIFGEFLDDVGAVFRNIHACVGGEMEQPTSENRYVMGVDLAKERDFTVITVMDEKRRQVVHFDRFNAITWDMQLPRIAETAKRYNNAKVLVDSTGVGDPVFDQLKTIGVNVAGYKFTNPSKENLVRGLMIALENQEVRYPNIPELISELESFEYDISSSGLFRYSAPEGLHDDCVYSLALAVEASRRPTGNFVDFYKTMAGGEGQKGLDHWRRVVNEQQWQTQ